MEITKDLLDLHGFKQIGYTEFWPRWEKEIDEPDKERKFKIELCQDAQSNYKTFEINCKLTGRFGTTLKKIQLTGALTMEELRDCMSLCGVVL